MGRTAGRLDICASSRQAVRRGPCAGAGRHTGRAELDGLAEDGRDGQWPRCHVRARGQWEGQGVLEMGVEPVRGFEPRTYALRMRCSTN